MEESHISDPNANTTRISTPFFYSFTVIRTLLYQILYYLPIDRVRWSLHAQLQAWAQRVAVV